MCIGFVTEFPIFVFVNIYCSTYSNYKKKMHQFSEAMKRETSNLIFLTI